MDSAPDDLKEELRTVRGDLTALGQELGAANRTSGIRNAIQASSTVPTGDQLWQVEQLWEDVPGLVERVNALVTVRVPALNDRLNELGLRPDPGEAVPLPRRSGR